jgi:esterase/lipase superfamily enzyme
MRSGIFALLAAIMALAPVFAYAQSAELVHAYQNFESAKAAAKTTDALKYAQQAIKFTDASGDRQNLIELLRNVGDYAAQAGEDIQALAFYSRALELQSVQLGAEHPDLVPLLTAMTDLALKDKRYADAETLLLRVAAIERTAFGEHHENVLATLRRLRDVYRTAGDQAAAARVEAQMQPVPAPSRDLPTRRYVQKQGFATVRVYYGTNRAPSGDLKPASFYGNARGDLQYGYLDVTIPQVHQEAELETQPRWLEYTLSTDKATMRSHYVLLDKVAPLPQDEFVRSLRRQINDTKSKDIFIFVHGFNNSFEDSARRVAQLAYDLDFDGTPMLYSWPSQASASAYTVDEATVGISGRRLADFLETVVAQSGAQRIHLIAHSMGNRALIEALQSYLARRAPENRRHIFGQIVLTAPDVDRDYFTDAIQALTGSAERVTLYASDNDYALHTSQIIHGAPRAGTAGDVIVKLAGLDSIDMSSVPADALGHSYFAANSGAIFDMFRLLWRGEAPPQRCGMSNHKAGGTLIVWSFNSDACKGDDMLEAGVMLKRFGDLARDQVVANIKTLTDPTEQTQWKLILARLDGLLPTVNQAGGAPK